jgi:D-ribose pyranase
VKKSGILNSEISKVLSDMGHTDILCICDRGFPIPKTAQKIDISLEKGVPSFIQTLKVVSSDMIIEKIFLASEIKEKNKTNHDQALEVLHGIQTEYIPQAQFINLALNCRAFIRTGEATPYSNIILQSGVSFS